MYPRSRKSGLSLSCFKHNIYILLAAHAPTSTASLTDRVIPSPRDQSTVRVTSQFCVLICQNRGYGPSPRVTNENGRIISLVFD